MGSKLGSGNGMWESSRFMLPEHVEGINKLQREQLRQPRKVLADHELEQINRVIQLSMQQRVPISIKMYHPFEQLRVVGAVENISKLYGQFKVNGDWFSTDDIVGVESAEL